MLPSERIVAAAKGKWPQLLQAIGIPKDCLVNRHGPCPLCQGKDRFRFDDQDGRGTYYCSHCGAGDGLKLSKLWLKLDLIPTIRRLEEHVGSCQMVKAKERKGGRIRWVRHLWSQALPLADSPACCAWWLHRGGSMPQCPDLRSMKLHDKESDTWWPGMVALVRNQNGDIVGNHRTFLDQHGQKAPIEEVRRTFGEFEGGAAIRLFPVADHLGIAEGIETAFAATKLFGVPTWSAMTANLLAAWVPPTGVTAVTIYGDADESFTGQAAAFTLARRMRVLGLSVDVMLPEFMGQDWDDVWMENLKAA